MVLKALEIQGFKSFPDKIKITFDKGFTGVVGPNGSGKSNISDAIRWVLGETSAKQLRGGGKMENVIFGGTQKRNAMGFAAVHLIMDNTDRLLDVDADEVAIGRKYYRSGESEYSVNGQAVRLRDIYEMFLDTGLGRDGYSIIGQGRIAEIVSGKSDERREIFEEASGIARYRYRKNEAERKLAASEENLVRLRDILAELESRVGPLKKESEKAQSFLEYAAVRKNLEITLWMDIIQRAKETVRVQQRKMEIAQSDYDVDTRKMDELDAERDRLHDEDERLILANDGFNQDIRTITEEKEGIRSRIAVKQNDIEHNEASIVTLRAEMENDDASDAGLKAQIEECEQKITEASEKIAEYDRQIAERERLLAELTQKSQSTGERRGEIAQKLATLTEELTNLRVESASAVSSAQAAKERLASAVEELANAREQLETLKKDKADTVSFDNELQEKITQLKNIREGLDFKLASRTTQLQKAQEASAAIEREVQAGVQRVKLLKELERNMEGYQNSVKSVIHAAENHRLRGVIGPVTSILNVKEGYQVAIETALGGALQDIVVQNEIAAKAAISYLKEERVGRATFLPLDTVQGYQLRDAKLGDAVLASSVVEYDAKYENIVFNLLGRIAVTEDINEAGALARQNGYRFRVVTKDGQVVNAGGSFTGGAVVRTAGVFSRKQEIEELSAKLIELDKKKKNAVEEERRFQAEVDALNAELTATDSELITNNGDAIRTSMEKDRLDTAISQQETAAASLESECVQLESNIAAGDEAGRRAEQEIVSANEKVALLEQEMESIDGNDNGFVENRTRLSEELSNFRLEQLACSKDIDMHRNTIEGLRGRSGQSRQLRDSRQENINQLQQLIEAARNEIAEIEAQASTIDERIKAKEESIRKTNEQRMQLEKKAKEMDTEQRSLSDHREEMGREVARLGERKDSLEKEYEATVNKLWEEYELTLTDASAFCVEFENIAELRRKVGEIRGKIKALGNVNVGAIDEYAEVGKRYEFMKTQVGDVENAKAELQKMIAELSGEMKEIFSKSFAEINDHFGKIFAELFGGGTASLTLSEPEDVLESGIDIEVAPPGKIIKNLNSLSGGEQALVAVSIYFAILAVNPSPFCVLDEIEAALDDVNVVRYAQYLQRISDRTQFIVITHRRGTMEAADVLYGVTMQEDGVSKILRLDAKNVDVSMIGGKQDGAV